MGSVRSVWAEYHDDESMEMLLRFTLVTPFCGSPQISHGDRRQLNAVYMHGLFPVNLKVLNTYQVGPSVWYSLPACLSSSFACPLQKTDLIAVSQARVCMYNTGGIGFSSQLAITNKLLFAVFNMANNKPSCAQEEPPWQCKGHTQQCWILCHLKLGGKKTQKLTFAVEDVQSSESIVACQSDDGCDVSHSW